MQPKTKPLAAARTSEAESAPSRDERKQRTREHLMAAALALMDQGRGFSSLSLREVTRQAGVVPAAFYRHFRDLEELGLALVEQGGVTLRRLLRDARRDGIAPTHMIRGSVLVFKRYVEDHHRVFSFLAGERSGGSPVIRNAIRNEEGHFAAEMAQDLRLLGLFPDLSMDSLKLICGLVVATMFNATSDILDLPRDQPRREQELVDNFVSQLRLIFIGARHWREAS